MVTRIRRSDRPPEREKLRTLRDAATYVTGLPKKEAALPEWQAAIEALILVADRGGPTMFARIGVMRALNRHVERVFDPSRKEKLGQAQTRARSMMQEARRHGSAIASIHQQKLPRS